MRTGLAWWVCVVLGVASSSCDEKPAPIAPDVPAYARPKPQPAPEVEKSAPPRPKPEPAASCKAAYERAAAALAKRDFRAVAETIHRPLLDQLSRDVAVPANLGVMGHALATSGPKGSIDALAAILNRSGAMLTVEERMKGLDFDQMADVTSARASKDLEGYAAALLEWADDAGYPGDPLAAISGAQSENPVVGMAIDPNKGLVGSLMEKDALPKTLPKPKVEHAAPSAYSFGPLFALLLPDAKVIEKKNGTELAVSVGGKLRGTVPCAVSDGWFLSRPSL